MKTLFFSVIALTTSITIWGQQPYYNNVNLTLTGQDLYFELQNKIDQASSSFTYGDARDALQISDEDTNNSNNVLLVYGYDDTDGNCTTDRSRSKADFGGSSCQWNREHVFARSLANPPMGSVDNNTTGIGADPHNIRSSDQQMNNNKGDKKFASGSGNAGNVGSGHWYPGDEWKGDVARMLMYMYTRYGDRCLPTLAGVGSLQGSTQMLQLFLQWNVEDPVTPYEDQRNEYFENAYGNRNPFIDNPYLATIIWGGPIAEDRWNIFSIEDEFVNTFIVYPNPAEDLIYFQTTTIFDKYVIYDLFGKEIATNVLRNETSINIATLKTGIYLIEFSSNKSKSFSKLVVK
ncbi:MAG: endonuclease [Flavobacteriaceae bacterium]|nr:endonuclease [Flavobacteriaceae bacterium]